MAERGMAGRVWPTAALAALVWAGLSGCSQGSSGRPPSTVRAEPLQQEVFVDSLRTVSTLEASDEVVLAAQAGGRIQRVLVRAGQSVRAGQLLLVLDQTQQRADVAALQARLERDALNYRRYQQLVQQGAASALQRDEFRAAYIATREELRARTADLSYKDVRAPITGTLGDLSVKVGDVIQAGAALSTIVRNTNLQARIDIPAQLAPRLAAGQPVQLLSSDGRRPLAQGRITSLDPSVQTSSQTLLALATVSNPSGGLRNGQRLETRVILGARRLPAVPFTAVNRQFGQAFVSVAGTLAQLRRDPGRADLQALAKLPANTLVVLQRPVQLGELQGEHYPLLSGLSGQERVIVSGNLGLRHGQPIRLAPGGSGAR